MKVTFYHDVRKSTQNNLNQYPVMIRISNNTKTAYLSTGVYCLQECFVNNASVVVISIDGSASQNQTLLLKKMEVEVKIQEGIRLGRIFTDSDPSVIKNYLVEGTKKVNKNTDIVYLWTYVSNQKTHPATTKLMLSLLNSYLSIQPNTDVRNITADWLKNFVKKATKKYSGKTIKLLINCLRQTYKYAQQNSIVVTSVNPFHRLLIPTTKKVEFETLTKQQYLALEGAATTDAKRNALNMLKLSMFLCGMNLTDLYHLQKKDVKNGKITFVREKMKSRNGDKVTITIPEVLTPIIEGYKDKTDSPYFFNFHTTRYDIYYQRIIYQQESLGKTAGVKVTTYTARYTWASTAFCLGVQEAVIDLALGHRKRSEAMRSYVKPDFHLVDDANEKVIRFFTV